VEGRQLLHLDETKTKTFLLGHSLLICALLDPHAGQIIH